MANRKTSSTYSQEQEKFEKDYKRYREMVKKQYQEYEKYIKNHTKDEIREETISWLENVRSSGEFVDQFEENIDFNKLTDDEIDWYFEEWVFQDKFYNDNL